MFHGLGLGVVGLIVKAKGFVVQGYRISGAGLQHLVETGLGFGSKWRVRFEAFLN